MGLKDLWDKMIGTGEGWMDGARAVGEMPATIEKILIYGSILAGGVLVMVALGFTIHEVRTDQPINIPMPAIMPIP